MNRALLTFIQLLLCLNFVEIHADLMDLISEASCAARCFNLFIESLIEPDKQFLQRHPELTEPHCISQKGECSLCLEVCQWPRSRTEKCKEACDLFFSETEHQKNSRTEPVCLESCTFAQTLYKRADELTRGQLTMFCPRAESWPTNCRPTCQKDSDCHPRGLHKCCPTPMCNEVTALEQSVNRTWVNACSVGVPSDTGVPFVPGRPIVKQTEVMPQNVLPATSGELTGPTQYQLQLDWPDYYQNNFSQLNDWGPKQYPAVFLVQLRLFHDPSATVNFGVHGPVSLNVQALPTVEATSFTDRFFGEWQSLVWTTRLGAVLSDLKPSTWYQFRLMALSTMGYGGWSEASQPIRVLTRPVPPSIPRNLTEVRSRIFEQHVDVTIQWQEPDQGNLPLKKYQITWRRYYGFSGDDRSSFTEYEANVPGDTTVYTIQNLKPGSAYRVEVRAVSVFEGKELKSRPANLYVTTIPVPVRQAERVEPEHLSDTSDPCRCGYATQSVISVDQPFFENQILKAKLSLKLDDGNLASKYVIEWTPRVCIETAAYSGTKDYLAQRQIIKGIELLQFMLTRLLFQCHYKVTVQLNEPDSETETQQSWTTCFCTPSCHSVVTRTGPAPINCTEPAQTEIFEPMKLTYSILPTVATTISTAANTESSEASVNSALVQPLSTTQRADTDHSSRETYDAVVKWYPLGASTQMRGRLRPSQNRRVTKQVSHTGVRGVRVTWGPRIFEPIRLEAYQQGLKPYLDPERAQSKVVDPRLSTLLLRGLQKEILYIVHVQTIGEHMDGPVSTLLFAFPNETPMRSSHFRPRIHLPLIVPLCILILIPRLIST
ncbi:unnamed protein product [Calicophoron daubneyi]|uniref:Fibronectin type-III domain-containing protein n=1 Tax=Calicophoron daubneyi TaxID=300641 RepID=A0AAV2TPJ3_CALDB